MSMSTLFTVLLMSTPFLEQLSGANDNPYNAFNLPILLQRFIATLFFWLDEPLDSEEETSFLRRDNSKRYFKSLLRLATEYSTAVIRYINKYTRESNAPDQPNSHRLLELAVYTLPLFGRGRLVSELIMEVGHQTFTSRLDTKTSPDSHITAVEIALCRHWAFTVYTNYIVYKNGNYYDKCSITQRRSRHKRRIAVLGPTTNRTWPLHNDSSVALPTELPETSLHEPPLRTTTIRTLLKKVCFDCSLENLSNIPTDRPIIR